MITLKETSSFHHEYTFTRPKLFCGWSDCDNCGWHCDNCGFCDNCGWCCNNCGWLRQLWTLRQLWSHHGFYKHHKELLIHKRITVRLKYPIHTSIENMRLKIMSGSIHWSSLFSSSYDFVITHFTILKDYTAFTVYLNLENNCII